MVMELIERCRSSSLEVGNVSSQLLWDFNWVFSQACDRSGFAAIPMIAIKQKTKLD